MHSHIGEARVTLAGVCLRFVIHLSCDRSAGSIPFSSVDGSAFCSILGRSRKHVRSQRVFMYICLDHRLVQPYGLAG
ncbi:hypothetical protein VNO77_02287 [Canavalia gladiata]|uniref:Uncharacterized protein n=1 Tax=Canavalia gladiata TaxID=3824 RepID=A0AAN9RB51_CANGL